MADGDLTTVIAADSRDEIGQLLVALARMNESLACVVAQVTRVNDLIGDISNASREQAVGIARVGDAVAQLDEVTQQNAVLVEQSAAASTPSGRVAAA